MSIDNVQIKNVRVRYARPCNAVTTIIFALIILLLTTPQKAQVTFSKDWIPGKRISRNYQFFENFDNSKSLSLTYRKILLNEMRQHLTEHENNRFRKEIFRLPNRYGTNAILKKMQLREGMYLSG